MTTTIWQQLTKSVHGSKQSKCEVRATPKGRTRFERFSLMENANISLRRYLAEDRSLLGDFLSSFAGSSIEKMVMLLNTRMLVASPSEAYSDYTPLGYAIVQNDPQAVDILLRFGACPQTAPCTSTDNAVTVLSPIHLALMYHCQPEIVDELLEHGATTTNVERQDPSSLFDFIARCTSKVTASALMSKISCLDIADKDKRTLLHLATKNCNGAVVSSVLNTRLVDVDKVDAVGKTALMYAAERNSPIVVQLLLDGGANVEVTDAWGRTALHFAVRRAGLKTVKMLLSSGANVCVEDRKGWTPLTYAFSHEKILHSQKPMTDEEDLINCLVDSSRTPISLSKRNFDHVAFLMARTCESETAMVQLLANNRDHASTRNNNGQMLIHVAAEFNRHAAVKWLIENGGLDANVPDAAGWQPLHYAAKGGNSDTMFYLLEQHGADVNCATPSGWTPIWILTRNGWTDLASDIVLYGCDIEHTMTVSALRQASSPFRLPLSLFDPKAQSASPVAYARSGSRLVTLAEFSAECKLAELAGILVGRDNGYYISSRAVQDGATENRKSVKR